MPASVSPDEHHGRHRSGAVARMLRMPVSTLRVWERRYQLTQPLLSASGQRLYSFEDVQRLALLKQLVDAGHAIGSLAGLDMAQLQQVAATHAGALAARPAALRPAQARQQAQALPAADPSQLRWRVAVVGRALFQRLQQPALLRRLVPGLQWLGPFDDAAQADAALALQPADAVLVQQPRLHAGWQDTWVQAAPGLAARPLAVLYRFGAEPQSAALADTGAWLLRDPQSDTVLAQWLNAWCAALPGMEQLQAPDTAAPAPPRWDDEALAEFAGLSTTIACECPRHVAELLMQLSHFEAYSAECEQRSPADAQLHRHLRELTASTRARFELALEHIARHEGLLPPA